MLDCINFNLLSPYTVGKMLGAVTLLSDLERTAGVTAERFAFQAMTIDAKALRNGRKYYGMAIDKFMGNSVIHRLGKTPVASEADIRRRLAPTHAAGAGEWVDICGMFAPKTEVDRLVSDIVNGVVKDLDTINERWHQLHADYYDMEWTWVCGQMLSWFGKTVDELTADDIRTIVQRWIKSVTELDAMLLEDARKEYSLKSRTGFGIDCPGDNADDDFVSVRGEFGQDPFVKMVEDHIATKSALAEATLELLGNC